MSELPKLRQSMKQNVQAALHLAACEAITKMFLRSDIYPFKSCINCLNFEEGTEKCKLADARPPARVIVFGCSEHKELSSADDDLIPF